jgi:hypothetical protein
MEVDPTVIRYAYLKAAGIDELHVKLMHLSDVTGRGRKTEPGERRPRTEVAREYAAYPDGSGARIKSYGSVVTDRTAQVAADPERRREYETTGKGRERSASKCWRVRWSGDIPVAEQSRLSFLKTLNSRARSTNAWTPNVPDNSQPEAPAERPIEDLPSCTTWPPTRELPERLGGPAKSGSALDAKCGRPAEA